MVVALGDDVGQKFKNAGSLSIREKTQLLMREVRHSSLEQDIHGTHRKTGLPLTNSHNVRSAKLSFHIPHAGVMHGLAGYFEAVLYGDVGLSIHPHGKEWVSKDMLSWFPLFFPFRVCFSPSSRDTLSELYLF